MAALPPEATLAALAVPWLLRAAVAALAVSLAIEAALVALSGAHREDAWQLPMIIALLWQAALKLAAYAPPEVAAATAAAAAGSSSDARIKAD
jgi:hypothetical protein